VAEHAYTPISEFMTTNVETLEYDDSIVFALYKMDLGGFRHIPLYRDGQISGIVSVRDFLRYLAEELLAS
jgi:CBS domain-containing protein